MSRSVKFIAALGLATLFAGSEARAQMYYPGGYGGYGWRGWGGGATPQGDMARGMGVFATGAGYYNEATAEARSINANTAMNWNEYMYQSQQAVNKKYYAKMAARQKELVAAQGSIYQRLHDNPNQYDIYRGDAMNVVYDELCSPKVYINGLTSAAIKFPGDMIRDIPFQYASEALTATVHSVMTKGSAPKILKTETYKAEMDTLRELGAKVQKQDEDGQIDPETLDKLADAIVALQKKVADTLDFGSHDRNEADRFLKAAAGLTQMMRTPAINVLLADADNHPNTNVGQLLSFMKAFNLRFGAADDPREKMVYDQLYPLLLKLRDEAMPNAQASLPPEAEGNFEHPAEFFANMDPKALDPRATPPRAMPKTTTPAPPKPGTP